MSILVSCRCGKHSYAPEDAAGKRGRCAVCGAIVMIPGKNAPKAGGSSLEGLDRFESAAVIAPPALARGTDPLSVGRRLRPFGAALAARWRPLTAAAAVGVMLVAAAWGLVFLVPYLMGPQRGEYNLSLGWLFSGEKKNAEEVVLGLFKLKPGMTWKQAENLVGPPWRAGQDIGDFDAMMSRLSGRAEPVRPPAFGRGQVGRRPSKLVSVMERTWCYFAAPPKFADPPDGALLVLLSFDSQGKLERIFALVEPDLLPIEERPSVSALSGNKELFAAKLRRYVRQAPASDSRRNDFERVLSGHISGIERAQAAGYDWIGYGLRERPGAGRWICVLDSGLPAEGELIAVTYSEDFSEAVVVGSFREGGESATIYPSSQSLLEGMPLYIERE